MYFSASTFLAPPLYKFSADVQIINFLVLIGTNLHYFGANLESKFKKNIAETAPSNGDIWNEFRGH